MSWPSDVLTRRLVFSIGGLEAMYGLAVTILMTSVLADGWHDSDAWTVLYIGLAFLIVPTAGMIAAGLARHEAVPRAVLASLVVMAAAYGGALIARHS